MNRDSGSQYRHMFILLFFILLLAQVTYNQVQPLRINYMASSHRGIKIDSVQHKFCITSWVTV